MDESGAYNSKRGPEHLLQGVQPGLPLHRQERLQQQLQQAIAYLIANDFERLVQLLYKVDVNEKHLKSLLQQQQEKDAAETITRLVIERQLQKAALRQQYTRPATGKDEELW